MEINEVPVISVWRGTTFDNLALIHSDKSSFAGSSFDIAMLGSHTFFFFMNSVFGVFSIFLLYSLFEIPKKLKFSVLQLQNIREAVQKELTF